MCISDKIPAMFPAQRVIPFKLAAMKLLTRELRTQRLFFLRLLLHKKSVILKFLIHMSGFLVNRDVCLNWHSTVYIVKLLASASKGQVVNNQHRESQGFESVTLLKRHKLVSTKLRFE